MKRENSSYKAHIIEFSDVKDYFQLNNKTQFLNSLTQCYQNPLENFNRITSINNNIFIIRNEDKNEIMGYLFFCDKKEGYSNINNLLTKHLYNGYAFISELYRQKGVLKELLKFTFDYYCRKYENKFNQLLFYAITSNPIALRGYYKVFPETRPVLNGLISDNDILIAKLLKSNLFIDTKENDHPFTIKTSLPQRYLERVNISFKNSGLNEVEILHDLNINEECGDRFLFYWTALLNNRI